MGFLTGNRSRFPENIDQIKELYDLPPSLREDAIRYQELISKTNLSTEDSQELERLTTKLSDYIITAEDRNYFGDVVIKIQKFFKENVQDFVLQKQTEFNQTIQQKKDEIIQTVNTLTNLVEQKKQEIINFVTTSKEQANEYKDTKNQEIQIEIDKFKDFGLWTQTKQYHSKNIVHYEGNAYLAKKDNINTTPVATSNDTWELLTIKGDVGYSVNLQPKGTFSVSTNYIINDLVNYKGNLFYCKKNCNGILPTDESYWNLFLAGNGEILTDLQTNHKLSLVGAVNENKTRIDEKADKNHTHNSLEIYDDDELLLANNFNNPAGNIYINFRGANSPIKNYILGAGISEDNNNNLANLKVKELLEGNIKLIDKYALKDGGIFQPKILPNGADLNNIKEAGIYICDLDTKAETILNKASENSKAFILTVVKPNSDSVTQYFTYYKVGNDKTYVRGFYRSWNNWSEVAYTKDVAVLNRENVFTQNQKFEINKAPILQLAGSPNSNSIKWRKVNTNTIFGAMGVHADGDNPIKMYFGFGSDNFTSPALTIKPNGDLKAKNKIYSNNKEVALKEDITRMDEYVEQETSARIVLSKLKTVDGIGSGLDADLLDGKNSSDFMSSNKGDGTLANDLGVTQFMRWKHYGQNHIIFDASNGTTPSGRGCDRINPEVGWYNAICPNLMGWNGNQTYGVKVAVAGWAEAAHSANHVQGFQFRNNNGQLEVLVGGVWLSVGAKQYTVIRAGQTDGSPSFDYQGGAGIIRSLFCYCSELRHIAYLRIDGVEVPRHAWGDVGDNTYFLQNIEFKNSVYISPNGSTTCRYLVQTEK